LAAAVGTLPHGVGLSLCPFHGLLDDDVGTLISHQDKSLYSFFNTDFISTHIYATDPLGFEGANFSGCIKGAANEL